MGMHTDLSIYKASLGLLQMATNLTRNIPRDLKQSLGKRVIDECIDVLAWSKKRAKELSR